MDLSVAIVAMVVKSIKKSGFDSNYPLLTLISFHLSSDHTVSNSNDSDVQCPGLSNDSEDEVRSNAELTCAAGIGIYTKCIEFSRLYLGSLTGMQRYRD